MESYTSGKSYYLSSHARERMEQRGVSIEEVLLILNEPDECEPAEAAGRMRFWGHLHGRSIAVIVDGLSRTVVTVITASSPLTQNGFPWFSMGAAADGGF